MDNQTVTVEQLANMLNLTPRRVQQLASDGTLLRGERGRYLITENVRRYIGTLESRRDPAIQDLNAKKGRLLDIEVAKRDGRLIELAEAQHFADELTGAFLTVLDGLPSQIADKTAGRSSPQKYTEHKRLVEAIITDARNRLVDRFAEVGENNCSD